MSKRRVAVVFLVIIGFVALGVGLALALHPFSTTQLRPVVAIGNPTPKPAPTPSASPTPGSGRCHSVGGLPDPICTPGFADPRVRQDNVLTTICVSGYTKRVRPSSRYTDALKIQQIKAYGYSDTNLADYEEDHLIPLELGGHPTDPRNLWPEPRAGDHGAAIKDRLENSLHVRVCSGAMTLGAAQAAIATDWEAP